ncbi:MAG: glycosyltransferase [Planctomycetota bacterium]
MDWPPVALVIVNWNGRDLLGDCLESLARLDYPSDRLRILVVDNLSTDDSLEFLRSRYPRVETVSNDANNYARANNLGVRLTDSPYVALLNNDTRVDKAWLRQLVAAMEECPEAAAAGSRVLFMDGRINSTGLESLEEFHWRDRGFGEEDRGQYDRRETVQGISGCSMILRRTALRRVGLLDEDFEMYYEDVDLCFRLCAAGYKLLYEPTSVVHHRYNATIRRSGQLGGKDRFGERNRLYIIARHFPGELSRWLFASRFLLECSGRELKGFLPRLTKKWIEAGTSPREARSHAVMLLQGKLRLLRHVHRNRALQREIAHLHLDKQKMLDEFHAGEARLIEKLADEQRKVIATRERLEGELNATHENFRAAAAAYERVLAEVAAERVKDRAAYEGVVAEAEAARDKARGDFASEQERRKEREKWLRILITELAMRRVRPLDVAEQAFLEVMERGEGEGGVSGDHAAAGGKDIGGGESVSGGGPVR